MIRHLADRIVRAALESITARLTRRITYFSVSGPYLSRWPVAQMLRREPPVPGQKEPLPLGRACLHFFHQSDEGRELHTHPWKWAFALQLAGGYSEERRVGNDVVRRDLKPGNIVFLRAATAHRVDLLDPMRGSWSLIIHGPLIVGIDGSVGAWGFLDRETWTYRPHREVTVARGITTPVVIGDAS